MKIIRAGIVALLFMLCLHLSANSSAACSLEDGYLLPSNYDLVKETQAILLAEAVSFDMTPRASEGAFLPQFTFKILEVLKGDFAQDSLVHDGVDNYLGKSVEGNFNDLRRGAMTGACNAYDYQLGKKFLLFVNKTKDGWIISGPPFSRINEEVSNSDSPWVIAVRHYIRISSLNNYEAEKVALKRLQENARRGKATGKYPAGLVKDVERYFKSPYPTKSYQDLLTIYQSSSREVRRNVLWAFAQGKHPEAKSFIQNLMQTPEWEEYIAPVSELVKLTKDRSFIKTLADAYLKMKGSQMRWPLISALIEVADDKDSELMLAALQSADEEEAVGLAAWFVRHPVEEATDIIRKLVDAKYRKRWALAFSLAGLGDERVLEWAREMIHSSDQDSWVGYYIIAHSPLAEADTLAKATIQDNNPKDLTPLIQGYKDSANPHRWDRLRDVISLRSKDSQVDYWLRTTLKDMAKGGDHKAAELLGIIK
jgi:HEAT repeat protein